MSRPVVRLAVLSFLAWAAYGLAAPGVGAAVFAGTENRAEIAEILHPAQVEVRRAVRRGEWPLWSPSTGAGKPLLAFPEAQALHPLAVPGWPLPLRQAGAVTAALQVLVALAGGFLLLRRAGAAKSPAAAGAAVYALGAGAAPWLGGPGAHAAALLPGLLWAVARTEEDGGRRNGALLVALFAAVLLGGDGAAVAVALATAFAFLLARLRRRPPRRRGVPFLRQLACLLLAAGLAAPVLLPARGWSRQTGRAAAASAAEAERLRRDPLGLATLADAAQRREAWRSSGRRLAALAGVRPVERPGAGAEISEDYGWGEPGAHAATAPAPAAGGPAPVRWGGAVAEPGLAASAGLLAAALLAALAGFRRRGSGPRAVAHRGFFAAAGVAALAAVARPPGVDAVLVWLHARPPWGAPWSPVLPVAALAAAWWIAAALQRFPRPPRVALAAAVAVLVTAARAAALGGTAVPLAADPLPAEAVAWLQARQAEGGWGRLVALGDLVPPHAAGLHGLADARGLPALQGAAWGEAMRPLLAGGEGSFGAAGHPLYDLLGVRWILAPPHEAVPPPAGPVARFGDVAVWERAALPLLFLPDAAERFAGGDWRPLVWERTDFLASSLYNPLPGGPLQPAAERWRRRTPGDSVAVRARHPALVEARARLDEPRLLATSLFQDGGWRLLAGGTARATTFVNGPFVGAWLPPGASWLTLLYRPPGFVPGAALAALSLAALALWLVPPPRGIER